MWSDNDPYIESEKFKVHRKKSIRKSVITQLYPKL